MAFALLQPSRHDVYPFIDGAQNLKGAATGKTVLVTGAGTGIGRGIAEAFALAGACTLVIAARRTDPLEATKASIAKLAPSCKVIVVGGTDVADQASVEKLFADLASPPDVVVSNAAISSNSTIADSDPDAWWRDVDVNLRGSYLIARTFVRAVRGSGHQKARRLINVGSNNSWRYIPGFSSYASSKIALNSLTEYVDKEELEAGRGLRCVVMHPGGVLTEMAERSDIPDNIKRMLIDQPALPGGTAVYLSTERADFLMGRYVNATWDMEQLEGEKERIEKDDLLRSRVVGVAPA